MLTPGRRNRVSLETRTAFAISPSFIELTSGYPHQAAMMIYQDFLPP